MNTVRIFDTAGEPFDVSKSRVASLLGQGWTLTKPEDKAEAVEAKKEPEARIRTPKAPTSFRDEEVPTADDTK